MWKMSSACWTREIPSPSSPATARSCTAQWTIPPCARLQTVCNTCGIGEKLTDELDAAITAAKTLSELEDLYRPYKPKRRTRATVAKEKGLEPLAQQLFSQARDLPAPEELAQVYIDPEKGVETVADALAGASDIIAEAISDDAAIRGAIRQAIRAVESGFCEEIRANIGQMILPREEEHAE